jgi:TPR repeat protein
MKKVADSGNIKAQFNLEQSYYKASFTNIYKPIAKQWLTKVAENKNVPPRDRYAD